MAEYDLEIFTATDRALLEQMLDVQRAEVVELLDGITDEEARAQLVPSLTTLLGLVKHAAFVERVWFGHRVAGRSRADVGIPDEVDDSFRLNADDTISSLLAGFQVACAESRQIAADHPDLAETFPWRVGPVSLGFIYVHMIQEYARHCGHGDILREQLAAARST
ncbi:MAG TPA: DinB family protein [Marmoricola sp.]|nr:DinB family protein [Marmoricola sp.]